ncbi:hypothetical protein [Streptomyces yerevanensis]|uniref:hypothetical protein n=1 Tax=Streptomyces yerevanensis TaxID=66378 RepID=UPI0012FEB98D|nr:hypothetical protein [Streptomyces yerevanensis]
MGRSPDKRDAVVMAFAGMKASAVHNPGRRGQAGGQISGGASRYGRSTGGGGARRGQ